MTRYQNKYRVESTRLPHWDYGSNASYFVTICTHQRLHFFGEVITDRMQLSEMGQWAHDCWAEIPTHFPFVKLDAYVVMPNHVHGIIIIDKPDDGNSNAAKSTQILPGNPVFMITLSVTNGLFMLFGNTSGQILHAGPAIDSIPDFVKKTETNTGRNDG